MVNVSQDAALRGRWRNFFSETLRGDDHVFDVAADAAIAAIQGGGDSDQAIAAGMAAARAAEESAPSTPSGRPGPVVQVDDGRAAPTPREPASTPQRVWPTNSGVVSSLERRSESLDGTFFQVLSCRLLRLEDGRRPVPPLIPVELRGRVIIGQLTQGDVVAIPPGHHGHTRLVKTLNNLTTDSVIEAKGRPFRRARTVARSTRLTMRIVSRLVSLAILVALAMIAYWLVTGSQIELPFEPPGR